MCKGQYPPALQKVLAQRKDFQQLEDFNTGGDDSEYQRQYMENVAGRNSEIKSEHQSNQRQPKKEPRKQLGLQEIELLNSKQENSEHTTILWQMISEGKTRELKKLLAENPQLAHMRSSDGRGPMWWAHENNEDRIIEILKSHGVSDHRTDEDGVRALDLS